MYFDWVLSKVGSLKKADLIVVFWGDEERVKDGFKLARSGYASHFVISPASNSAIKAFEKRYGTFNPGVSLIIEPKARTTFENAVYTKRIALEHGFKSLILVTSFYHMPRANFLLRYMLVGTNTKVLLFPVDHGQLNGNNWFESYEGIKLILHELIKFWASIIEIGIYLVNGDLPESNPKEWPGIKLLSSVLF